MDPVGHLTLRAALALLFAAAALHKLRDPARFATAVAEYRLVPARSVAAFARALPVGEIAIAAAAAVGVRAAFVVAAALLAVYTGAIAVNLARGRRLLDCGCLGSGLRQPLGWGLVARNAGLVVAALAGLAPVASRPLVWLDAFTVVAATLAVVALWAAATRVAAVPEAGA
jgi:hypothetical protein